tara:strand:- start:167 stop:310 length:144 start_codon:yes stop_codon:yes gene_type:complete
MLLLQKVVLVEQEYKTTFVEIVIIGVVVQEDQQVLIPDTVYQVVVVE